MSRFRIAALVLASAAASTPAVEVAFGQEDTREPGEFVCVVGLINAYAGEASCFDGGETPGGQYEVLLFRIGPDYLGRLPCSGLACSAPETIRLDYRAEETPWTGEIFYCLSLDAETGVWACSPRLTD